MGDIILQKNMCQCQSESISAWQLLLPIASGASTVLNMLFIYRNWNDLSDGDHVLRNLSFVSFGIMLIYSFVLTVLLSQNSITKFLLRILFVVLGTFNMIRVYIYMYQRFAIFGIRLKSIQKKFALANYSLEFIHFLFNYLIQFFVQYTFLKNEKIKFSSESNFFLVNQHQNLMNKITLYGSIVLTIISVLIIFIKTCSLVCFEEEDVMRDIFFMEYCCRFSCICDCSSQQSDDSIKQFQDTSSYEGEWRGFQDWTTQQE